MDTLTYINVESVEVYTAAYPGGTPIASSAAIRTTP